MFSCVQTNGCWRKSIEIVKKIFEAEKMRFFIFFFSSIAPFAKMQARDSNHGCNIGLWYAKFKKFGNLAFSNSSWLMKFSVDLLALFIPASWHCLLKLRKLWVAYWLFLAFFSFRESKLKPKVIHLGVMSEFIL